MTRFSLPFALVMCASLALQNQISGAPWKRNFSARSKQVIIEGDIILTPSVEDLIKESEVRGPNGKRKVVKANALKFWPGARVPYEIDPNLSAEAKKLIHSAVKEFHNKTCVRFVPKKQKDQDYVHFYRDIGCFSAIGRQGGRQRLSVGSGCEHKGTVMHEMMHALGFFHEHTRPDRDNYVRINWWNIEPGKSKNFESYRHGVVDTLNLAYDYDSVMHYHNTAFSVNLADTIQARNDPKKQLGTSETLGHFSSLDITAIGEVYRCRFPSQPRVTDAPPAPGPPINTDCQDEIPGDTCPQVASFAPFSCVLNDDIKLNCKKSCGLCG